MTVRLRRVKDGSESWVRLNIGNGPPFDGLGFPRPMSRDEEKEYAELLVALATVARGRGFEVEAASPWVGSLLGKWPGPDENGVWPASAGRVG